MKKSRSQNKTYNRSGARRFFLLSVMCLLVVLIIASIVYWQWEGISSWVSETAIGITQVFGWGLVLIVLAVLTLTVVILTYPRVLWHFWNRWIGGLIVLAAVWGILAFFPGEGYLSDFTLGGEIGQRIIGPSVPVGILLVLLMFIIGTFFIIPRKFAGWVAGACVWVFNKFKKEPVDPALIPAPEPQKSPLSLAEKTAEEEADIKLNAFPRYNTPPKPKAEAPVNGSKNWLWNRLHPRTESADPRFTSSIQLAGEVSGKDDKSPAEAVAEASPALPAADTIPDLTSGELPEEKKVSSKELPKTSDSSPKDTRQLAQEVWKKYGEAGAQATADGWKLPPIEILDASPEQDFSQADNMKKAKLIEDALASYGVEGKVVQINVGPTVTQFGIEPGWDRKLKEVKEKDKNGDIQRKIEEVSRTRVKVDRITSLANDLALALAAPSIRIEAPVPGKPVVGIEVPNTTIGVVSMRNVVESNTFQKMAARTKMAVALGTGAGGESVVGDLTKMPHLLIAGATGSGKTVCMHAIICCLLLHNTPNDVRFIMIDPKRVEMTSYNSLPHLATGVIVENNRAILALRGLTQEMDKRYQTLAAVRARNIEAYNKARPNEKMPYLVLIIDELADLMMTAGEEVERTLCRLAQLARAVGIHLVVATQRPSVDVVTGLIKANFPTRISFAVTSQVDSRTILDTGGAEKLLGRGDMLYMPTEAAKPKRLQGCFLSDAEIERIVYFWNNQRKETASQLKMDDLISLEDVEDKPPADPLLEQARKLLDEHQHISASFLQRHLRIGYPRAARLMEQLEEEMGEGISELEDVKDEEE
jgi:S-DNA-T family DNA segregation ATPase FtsK/SpoIIIE